MQNDNQLILRALFGPASQGVQFSASITRTSTPEQNDIVAWIEDGRARIVSIDRITTRLVVARFMQPPFNTTFLHPSHFKQCQCYNLNGIERLQEYQSEFRYSTLDYSPVDPKAESHISNLNVLKNYFPGLLNSS